MYGYVRYRLGAILAEAWGRSASVDSCGVLVESWWSLDGEGPCLRVAFEPGEAVSVDGTHLGHNLPDSKGTPVLHQPGLGRGLG